MGVDLRSAELDTYSYTIWLKSCKFYKTYID